MVTDKLGREVKVGDVIVAAVWEKGKQVRKVGLVTRVNDDCAGCSLEGSFVVDLPTAMPCAVKAADALVIVNAAQAINVATL